MTTMPQKLQNIRDEKAVRYIVEAQGDCNYCRGNETSFEDGFDAAWEALVEMAKSEMSVETENEFVLYTRYMEQKYIHNEQQKTHIASLEAKIKELCK